MVSGISCVLLTEIIPILPEYLVTLFLCLVFLNTTALYIKLKNEEKNQRLKALRWWILFLILFVFFRQFEIFPFSHGLKINDWWFFDTLSRRLLSVLFHNNLFHDCSCCYYCLINDLCISWFGGGWWWWCLKLTDDRCDLAGR